MTSHSNEAKGSDADQKEVLRVLQENYASIIRCSGDQPERQGVRDTPKRAAEAFRFLTSGYRQQLDTVVNNALFESESDGMVVVKDIEMYSLCEHHMLPFVGKCHVGYLPDGKVLGLSKVARIVDMYARRLQIQETLTRQVAEAIEQVTSARGVGVIIEAQHFCMMMRGVEKQNSVTTTSTMLGWFRKDPRTRTEFLELIRT